MSQETQQPVTPPAGTTPTSETPQTQHPQPTPSSMVPPVAAPAPVNVGLPPNSTELATQQQGQEIDWRRRYDQLRGTLQAATQQFNQRDGYLNQQLTQLQDQLGGIRVQYTELQSANQGLLQQTQQLPELQQAAQLSETLQSRIGRLEQLMRYPQILSRTTVSDRLDDQGQVVGQDRNNAILDMLLTSTLEGEEFTRMVNEVATSLGTSPAGSPATQPAGNPMNMSTQPPQPVSGSKLEELRRLRNEASLAGDDAEFERLQNEIMQELQQSS